MKQTLKLLSLLTVLFIFNQNSFAGLEDSSIPQASAPIQQSESLYSELQVNAFSANLGLITDKFNNYGGAEVTFNSESIQLKVNKRSTCPVGKQCIMSIPAPVIIDLEVTHVIHEQCRDVYYAATPAYVKSSLREQIRIADYSVGRCQTFEFTAQKESRLQYQVTGISSLTKQTNSALIDFTLTNVQILLPTE